jgi:hypothetical protein
MAKFTCNNQAGLFLPGSEAVLGFGEEIDLGKDEVSNAAVAGWIKAGILVSAKDFAKPVVSEDTTALKAALATATADLEAERAKTAELQAKVDQLTADLEAVTKP